MFSWSSQDRSSGSKAYPGRRLNRSATATTVEGSIRPPSSEHTRAQHLTSYVDDDTLQRSTRRVSSDDTTYDTVFQTTKGDTLILRVNVPLTSSFATFCPAMTLAGVRAIHPWVEPERMRVTGYGPIQSEDSWKNSGLLLGAAVHEVVKHFQLNPPEIVEITDRGLQSIQPKRNSRSPARHKSHSPNRPSGNNGTNGMGFGSGSQHNDAPPSYDVFANSTPAPDVPMPSIPTQCPEIKSMDRAELDRYLENETVFLEFVKTLPVYVEIQNISQTKIAENANIAQENLGKESQLKELHQEVTELQQQLQDKISEFQCLEAEQDALCAPPDKRDILKKLNRAKKQAFETSEEYAEEWVEDGGPSINDFVKEFVALRKIHHSRGAKMEILQNSKQTVEI